MKFTGLFFRPAKVRKMASHALLRAMTTSVAILETEIKVDTPVGVSGNARSGVVGRVINSHRGIVAATGPAAKYWPLIEGGRKPTGGSGIGGGMSKSLAPIRLWVKRVIAPGDKMLDSVTFLVFRKIHQKGFKGKEIFKKNEKAARRYIQKIFKREMKRVEKKLSDKL